MFENDDPLKPPKPVFDEAWQAQVLAMADTMVQAGHFSATEWAETLGAQLKAQTETGAPDTLETYYSAALAALEELAASRTGISPEEQSKRVSDWKAAYLNTPHGKPVLLSAGQKKG